VRNFHAQNAGIIYKLRPHSRMAGCTKESRNRHDSDGEASKFLANAGPLAAIGLSAFKFGHHRTLSLTALRPTAIENHLSVRVSRESLHQMIVQGRMPWRNDEKVAGQAYPYCSTDAAAGGRSPSSARCMTPPSKFTASATRTDVSQIVQNLRRAYMSADSVTSCFFG